MAKKQLLDFINYSRFSETKYLALKSYLSKLTILDCQKLLKGSYHTFSIEIALKLSKAPLEENKKIFQYLTEYGKTYRISNIFAKKILSTATYKELIYFSVRARSNSAKLEFAEEFFKRYGI